MHHERDHENHENAANAETHETNEYDASKAGRTSPEHSETAAEEVFDEIEDAETRLPGTERDEKKREKKDGEAGDTLTPSPSAQEDARHDH
ncbi:hypothetical protein GPA10_33340 [Streptomyces sp. p1417]|uniref:Uncharacterized protein n=1 Tax=Streptomyces typhae TaxID=2681492 RepID=A0A6L6X7Y9_9ACTN|nr:hypothetical protein [Streptomyces typhae]MVO89509.1 hypothetical protein [Streptomyces typhae]